MVEEEEEVEEEVLGSSGRWRWRGRKKVKRDALTSYCVGGGGWGEGQRTNNENIVEFLDWRYFIRICIFFAYVSKIIV